MKYLIYIIPLLFIACQEPAIEMISNNADYIHFIQNENPQATHASYASEIEFWKNKIQETPNGFVYFQKLGVALANEFEKTGDINLIHESNNYFQAAMDRTVGKNKAATLLNLSSNAIKLHEFRKALSYAYEAEKYTDEVYGPRLMQYDALMEIGQYDEAIRVLKNTQREDDYNYIVRYAKYQDNIGQLDSAILLMELALNKVPHDETKRLWTLASLGDYYGHQGNVQKSYETFLSVLDLDPHYGHALQGISWIAYSNDNNPEAALEIRSHLDTQRLLPDQKLAMADIYSSMGNRAMEHQMINEFVTEATKPKYGNMYNDYLIDYYVDVDIKLAMELAKAEIRERPTPQTYTALAWTQYHNGNVHSAMETIKSHVINKTFEPGLLYKAGLIAAAAREGDLAKDLLEECKEAAFELGPIFAAKINEVNW